MNDREAALEYVNSRRRLALTPREGPGAQLVNMIDAYLAGVAAEREACAKLADIEHEDPGDTIDSVLTRLATAIRVRGG